MTARILVVDDEAAVRFTLAEVLRDAGFEVEACESVEHAMPHLEDVDVVLSDYAMPGADGLSFLKQVRADHASIPFIMVTARGSEKLAVTAMKVGAFDYLTKPFDIDEVTVAVRRATEVSALRKRAHRHDVERRMGRPIVGQSAAFQKVVDAALRVAPRDIGILICGETGTGKEVLASLIHAGSRRASKPFVRFNCAALVEGLAESELFGHVRGAFTGADKHHDGTFVRADGGTLLLDEVGELTPAVQAKLLRVLQEGEVTPVGSSTTRTIDVRILAATHRDLRAEVAAGRFREDLYYRLAVVELTIAPIRDRKEDILPLAESFRCELAQRFGFDDVPLPNKLISSFEAHDWPGNARELHNAVARILALSDDGRVDIDWSPPDPSSLPSTEGPLRERVASFERECLRRALTDAGMNQSEAARQLGITRTTLIDKLKRHDLWAWARAR